MTTDANASLDFETMIVGGGVVGLACAAYLARMGQQVLLIEKHLHFGSETSSRNSGVIHAGLYYRTGSLKARLCRRGQALLYARCERDGVSYKRCGKLVVADSDAEIEALQRLYDQAHENGATEVRLLSPEDFKVLEPQVRGAMALWSPATGIVDAHALMDSYRREAEAHGAILLLGHSLVAAESDGEGWSVTLRDERAMESLVVRTTHLVNAGGLWAFSVAETCGVAPRALGLRQHYCKGDYFRLAGHLRGLVTRLIYPMPVAAGLGVHLTMDLAGDLNAGPDTEYVDKPSYEVDAAKGQRFARAVQRYLPAVGDLDLTPNYAGVRPKLQGPGESAADFVLHVHHGVGRARQVHMFGIESPGLTASEALAEEVNQLLVD